METLFNTTGNACGAQCMDILTAAMITITALAVMVLAGTYALAGICKRMR
ncbi:MAG: hypothetical protein H7Y38_11125 [Armatimonadetes bacterium]|nr:hypothetical protein [Armatimonadota bacterium]